MAEPFAMAIDGAVLDELHSALEYLGDRLLGPVPQVLEDVTFAATAQFWNDWRSSGEPLRIHIPKGEPDPRTEAEIAAEDAANELAAEEYHAAAQAQVAWEQTPEGQAALEERRVAREREEQFFAFAVHTRSAETAALYEQWLEQEAVAFRERRNAWRQQRDDALLAEFEPGENACPEGAMCGDCGYYEYQMSIEENAAVNAN